MLAARKEKPEPFAPYPEKGMQMWVEDWSPDGTAVVGAVVRREDRSEAVYRYTFASKRYEQVSDLPGTPRYLSDGQRLLVVTEDDDIWLVDLRSEERKKLMTLRPDASSVHLSVTRDDEWIFYDRIVTDGDIWMAELE